MAERFPDRSCFDRWHSGRGKARVGTQLLPVHAPSRTSNSLTACFLAVDITERMLTKFPRRLLIASIPKLFGGA